MRCYQAVELWKLRSDSASKRIELRELGRILYHLNQKRGYKSSRSDANLDKKDTEYVAEVKGRHDEIKEMGITIGQKFYSGLSKDKNYRIKQQVFPREAYIEEFEKICQEQRKHYPEIINDSFIERLRNEIIYYQRKLKSQKGLVNTCEFEGFYIKNKDGKEVFAGPRVAPRSSPLFQVCKIWETINTLNLKNRKGEDYKPTLEEKRKIFDFLDNNEKLSAAELYNILGLNKADGWYHNKQIEKGLQGNLTKCALLKAFPEVNRYFQLELKIENTNEVGYLADKNSGEIIETKSRKYLSADIESQPLYQLWHTIYSISDDDECEKALIKQFGTDEPTEEKRRVIDEPTEEKRKVIDKTTAKKLADIDFTKGGLGNKSSKAIRKIMPYLMDGYVYSDACSFAGYNHSNSITKDENLKRTLLDKLPILPKNSLRQPVVEKILNQMINLVNAIFEKYGRPDEIRIELARELKQSVEERSDTFKSLNRRERENDNIRKRLIDEYGIRATRNNVIKFRLFQEIDNDDSKINAFCVYCGKPFGITDALMGSNVDVEHIIPKSLLFDDSQSNKTLSHRHCNEAKGNRTAFDYMALKGKAELDDYLHRVDKLYKARLIGKAKRDKLLMTHSKIPTDFINRQLRESQYIAKKSRDLLLNVCHYVWSTSGSVTEYLRRLWGWDDILQNLQFPSYQEHGLIETVEWESNGHRHQREVIKGWTKRNDHRHHAIDALVIACTLQGFIQRINHLSSQGNKDEMYELVKEVPFELRENLTLLEKYFILQRPFTTSEVEGKAAEILISFKQGKKVATLGRRVIKKSGKKRVVQTGIIVPRGPLSEESVYGKIKTKKTDFKTGELVKHPVKFLFQNPHLISKPYIKALVENRLNEYEGDSGLALASLKKNPIFLDKDNTVELNYATCYNDEYVIKYPLASLKPSDVKYIVDMRIQRIVQQRFEQCKGNEKEAFKEPLWFDIDRKIPIRTVRCFTGLSAVESVSKNASGSPIGFVKPGNNHHVAFYTDSQGKMHEHICTFWHAVERKRFGLPTIIKDPRSVWDRLLHENIELPESFLEKLPSNDWIFNESMQQNELFLLGLDKDETEEAIITNNKKFLSNYLYRVQNFSSLDYNFRHHTETTTENSEGHKRMKKFLRIRSLNSLHLLNPKKVALNNLGEFIHF